jgi:LysM repeat protein
MSILALYESDKRRIRNKRRRQRQLQKNLTLGITTIILVLALSVAFGSILANAEDNDTVRSYKYYTSIEVRYGETLWSIAEENMSADHYSGINAYIKEVMKINGLTDENITAGQYIIVPYFTDEYVGES